jgi:hypothetical protein
MRLKIFFVEFMRLGDFKPQGDQLLAREVRFDLAAQREPLGVVHLLNTVAHSNAQHVQKDHQRMWSHLPARHLGPKCCESLIGQTA